MPWSPIKFFPGIIRELKKRGHEKEVSAQILHTEVMRQTGLIRDYSIRQAIIAMERLGYIKNKGNGNFEITYKEEGEKHGGD